MRRDVFIDTVTKNACLLGLLIALPGVAACGGAAAEEKRGGRATVSIDGTTCAVSDVMFAYQPGEHGSFRLEGEGMALRGDLPSGVNSPVELDEKEVAFVTGGGEAHNLCFAGSKGMGGTQHGTVKFGRVFGGAIGFTFATEHASGGGTATIE